MKKLKKLDILVILILILFSTWEVTKQNAYRIIFKPQNWIHRHHMEISTTYDRYGRTSLDMGLQSLQEYREKIIKERRQK